MLSRLEKALIYEVACGRDKSVVEELWHKRKDKSPEGEDDIYFSFLGELFSPFPNLYRRADLRQKVISRYP